MAKGYLKNEKTGTVKKFIFNPNSYQESRGVSYAVISAPGSSYPKFQYASGGVKSITFSLFLWGTNGSVQSYIDFLEELLPPKQCGGNFSNPPTVLFAFGSQVTRCIVTNLDVDKQEFNTDLSVKQAVVNLSLTEVV